MSSKSGLPRSAESARHCATSLTAHADCGPVGVQHEHGLDSAAAVEFPQELHCVAGLVDRLSHQSERGWQLLIEPLAQTLGQVGDVGWVGELGVKPVPKLVESVLRLAVEAVGKRFARNVVSSRDGHSVTLSLVRWGVCVGPRRPSV